MAKQDKKSEQNIDGVLQELKKSYSADAESNVDDLVKNESVPTDVSHDELQAKLRSQFLNGESLNNSHSSEDDYLIDEDFLKDAYAKDDGKEDDNQSYEETDKIEETEETEKIEKTEEDEYVFYEGSIENDEEETNEKEIEEEAQSIQEASSDQSVEKEEIEEEVQEDNQSDKEIVVCEGLQALQEEEYYQAAEEIYEEEKDKEIQEEVGEHILLSNSSNIADMADIAGDESLEEDEEYVYEDEDEVEEYDDSLWNHEATYTPIEIDDADDSDEAIADDYEDYEDYEEYEEYFEYEDEDGDAFEMAVDSRTSAEISEDNYVDVFYLPNEHDPYENMSFKEKIAKNAPTVESLQAELENDTQYDASPEIKMTPIIIEDDDANADTEENDNVISDNSKTATMENFDRSDLALLLEFGYTEEVLSNVSDEQMESLSDAELMDDISHENQSDSDNFNRFNSDGSVSDDFEDDFDASAHTEEERTAKLKRKLDKQYATYRKKRGGVLLRFIISAVVTLGLLVYELVPIFNSNAGGIFNREEYFFAYVLVGLQLLIIAALPSMKAFIKSFREMFASGIDAYCVAGISLAVTVLYDIIVVFERKDIPPTFHFCAALVIVLAELSQLMKLVAEIRNFEYYFMEYLFDEGVTDIEKYKYTLAKNEGRGSVAEKMYLGGLDEKTVVYSPQTVDSAGGFFESSKTVAKKSKSMLTSIIASVIVALMFTIASGIIYEKVWLAASAFLITFNLTLPIIAIITEWIPFERLSSQNYSYGAAFASEGAAETLEKCDMLVFNDFHMFEKCESKNVNLAIYDSTSKAVLLSCLNSVYSEIGGPMQSAFANVKVQSLGECKINRVARSGVEARVGSNYSVLIGDEQFMSRYGIFFPKAELGREEDKIFTACVSINNRPTARIATKYKVNETFYCILQKLLEDKIYCTIQTYDPMISAELVAAVRPYKGAPVNIVHNNSADYAMEKHQYKSSALYSVVTDELPVLSRGSRLNLAVALSNAKKVKKLRRVLNISSVAFITVGTLTSLMLILSERLTLVNWLFALIYWLLSGAVMAGIMAWKFPQKDRFIFNKNKISKKKEK